MAFPILLSAQEARFPLHEVYFQHDNDVFRLVERTDQYYSFGLLTGYSQVIAQKHTLTKAIFFLKEKSNEKKIVNLEFALKGYTPEFEKDTAIGYKRPFAGVSVFQISTQSSNSDRMVSLGLNLGVRGPVSGAETVQDNFHRLTRIRIFEGWSSQLPNKVLYNIRLSYAKSIKLTSWSDFVSISEIAIGNYQTHLDQRMSFRIGKFRQLSESLMFRNHLGEEPKNSEVYLSATLIGRAVLVDTTFGKLDGEKFSSGAPNKSNLLAGYEVAVHHRGKYLGVFIKHNRISSESNFSTKHSYGSLGISYLF